MMIVFCGDLWQGSTARMRMEALERRGDALIRVDTTYRPRGLRGLIHRAARKAGWMMDAAGANAALVAAVRENLPDVVWVDKGLGIRACTLAEILKGLPNAKLVHYSPDDMGQDYNKTPQYLGAIPAYHLHVTNKSFNVQELRAMGARNVLFVNNAYCPLTHRPQLVNSEDRARLGGSVGFIGAFETKRAEAIWFLVKSGVPVRVWGEAWGRGWKKWEASHRHPMLKVEGGAVFGAEYAKAICCFDINLAFLRKWSRDLQTTRSVEIPACAAFMLAERTAEHQQLFEEGAEAEYFSSHEELLMKCQYYLAHPEARSLIAHAAYKRCIHSEYSYDRQMQDVLKRLNEINATGENAGHVSPLPGARV